MKLFEGKSPTERNKIIAAGVLGVLSLISLYLAFGRALFGSGSSVTATVTVSPTPKPVGSPPPADAFTLPNADEQAFIDTTTPVVYDPSLHSAPDPGRNIFAFYEPPPPTPFVPTPIPTPPLPTPTPTPPMSIVMITPQNVYEGSRGFRLEITGDKFTPDTQIFFSQSPLPTTFVNPQRLVAEISANLIVGEGPRQIIVQTPNGKLYSNQIFLNVQARPRPQFQYIGAKLAARSNNDTAYFQEQGRPTPVGARLNDIVGGRFRLVSISAEETVFEDVNLGFRHKLPLYRPAPGSTGASGQPSGGFVPGANTMYIPNPNYNGQPSSIPGIPDGIPRYVPPQPPQPAQKPDVDDEDDDGSP
jgi:hypothetical protein